MQNDLLLRSGLAKAEAAGLPVYLESSKPDNLPIYEHFGFTVLGDAGCRATARCGGRCDGSRARPTRRGGTCGFGPGLGTWGPRTGV